MLTDTDRVARTRLRATLTDAGRCRVRSAVTLSDPTAPSVRPVVMTQERAAARVSLVPEGALLLAGDAVEIDVEVEAGARLDLVEPGGTVAYDMRGAAARWSVRITLGPGAVLTWAGEPFVVSAGASVDRRTSVRMADGAALALRETLVLGRYGEPPGRITQRTDVTVAGRPALVEEMPLDPTTAPLLLGGHRVVGAVLAVGGAAAGGPVGPERDRYLLERGGALWRRLGCEAHEADLGEAWRAAVAAAGEPAWVP
ncbi:urease accessory protein UreD [Nocardioides sp. GY 10113]|uniref:urease accessory protein UreD n=1 Tax=Nocardioides sp. GY 10113 TaxID=2569761 RepID=UPI0010A7A351|nr:urease accessory protein UreD [Nocardioides sp. GY 10113]TIC87675.1 urease accessory protein UreD [Nocardioides sp. GY 10113]